MPVLEQIFLNPIGLLALLALVPLLIFYLARPQPEEKLMPSMMFFRKHEADSKLRSAFRRLMRNFVLLLHILIIAAFAFALAEPFAEMPERPDDAVLVLDRSASMQGQDIESFIGDNLGERNTVIATGSQTEVKAESVPADQAMSVVQDIQFHDTETDLISGLQTARNYPGEIVVASDLRQTVDDRNPEEILESTSNPVEVMDTDQSNTHAVTEVDVGDETTEISIVRYGSGEDTVQAQHNEQEVEIELEEGLNIHEIENEPGRNTFTLPDDGLNVDNEAFFYIPEHEGLGIYTVEEDSHFREAVDLIDEFTYVEEAENADVYFINGDYPDIADEVDDGDAAVLTKQSDVFEEFGLEASTDTVQDEVVIDYPQRISLGQVEYRETGLEGESLSNPDEVVQIHSYGEGSVLAFNAEMTGFRGNILYPVFWRHALLRVTDTPSTTDLNIQTGQSVTEGDETVQITETGFHEVGDRTYAANLESEDESSVRTTTAEFEGTTLEATTERNLQNLSVFLIALLILVELLYLYRIGELK